MTWPLTQDHDDLRRLCRSVADDHIRPAVEVSEREGTPRSLLRELGSAGLLGLRVDEAYGGSGGDALGVTIVSEELARASCGVAITALASAYMAAPHIATYGTETQRATHLPSLCAGDELAAILVSETEGGSDVAQLRTRAVPDGDAWMLHGTKMYITNGGTASLFVVAARTDGPGHRGISLFLVDASSDGIHIGPPLRKLGLHASDTREVTFDSVRLPETALLGTRGRGFHQVMERFTLERLALAGMAVGIASECLALAEERVRGRVTFGQPLAQRQAIRHRLAEMDVALTAARAVTYQAAHLADARDGAASRATAAAKLLASRTAQQIADETVQFFGGDGFLAGDPERHFRDARVLRIGGGADEVMLEILARKLDA